MTFLYVVTRTKNVKLNYYENDIFSLLKDVRKMFLFRNKEWWF